jgi:hypothetical protein
MILNCVLFVVIVGISVMMLRQENSLPGPPPVKELHLAVDQRLASEPANADSVTAQLEKLGTVNLFDTIIPAPTPAPSPTPEPPKPPPIEEVVKDWKLSAVLSSYALFQNRRTKEDWQMKIGESKTERFRNKDVKVYLDLIEKKTWSATVRITEEGQTQKKKFSVY